MDVWLILQVFWYGLVNGAAYVVFALGLSLIFGVMGILYMAHGESAMLGAMLTYSAMTYAGVSYWLAFPLAVAVVGAAAIAFNRLSIQPIIRVSRLSVLLSTMGLGYMLIHGSTAVWGSLPYALDTPFTGVTRAGNIAFSHERAMLFVLGAIGIVTLHVILAKAGIGKRMRATAQNPTGANLVGIDTKRVYDYTMMIGSALAALAGVVIGTVWTANTFLGQNLLVKGFVIVILGGMGNLSAVIGVGLGVGVLEALFGTLVSSYFKEAFIYGIMVVVLIFKPQGLFLRR